MEGISYEMDLMPSFAPAKNEQDQNLASNLN